MIDPEELRQIYNRRFSGSSKSWTSENIGKCLKLAGRILKWAGIGKVKNLSMLDVGCATGFYTKAFYMKGFSSIGLDYSEVVIRKAAALHPECTFIHANGLNPSLDQKFDLIFCRGFSGANTHNIGFVSEWAGRYIDHLTESGVFVFSYSTDFTGSEAAGETANWSENEIFDFIKRMKGNFMKVRIYHEYYLLSRLLSAAKKLVTRKPVKYYFYIFFSR